MDMDHGGSNFALVALPISVAMFASYTTLNVAGRNSSHVKLRFMGRFRIAVAVFAAISALGAFAAPLSAQREEAVNPFAWRLLAAQNEERDSLALPRLQWSARLASAAQAWAEHLVREGRMVHATQEQRRSAGENLWMGSAGYYGAESMVGAFLAERQYFRPGIFPEVSTTGQWHDVGHYTQIVWRETREVGCAVASGGGNDFLVCRYWPGGNWIGRPVY